MTGGEIVVRALEDEEIPFTFGIPGTHNIELYDALARSEKVKPILVTDEQSASFMADAVWRASGRLGCAAVVPGAGLTHAMSGIAEAFMDGVPMLVLGCGIRRDTRRAFQLHDVDQQALAAPVTKGCFLPQRGEEIYATIRRACRLARQGPPGPVFVEIPADLYLFRHHPAFEAFQEAPPAPPTGSGAELDQMAALLGKAQRPLLYVGLGAAGSGADLVALAEKLQAVVASTFQGKGAFPEEHPLFLWPGFGQAAPAFVRKVVADCDLTLALGCRFGEVATASYGLTPPQPLIHVDIDPGVLGRNYPAALGVTADAASLVRELLPRLPTRAPNDAVRRSIGEGQRAVWRDWEAGKSAERVTPALLLRSLQETFGGDAIFTTDSGNGTFLGMECLRLNRPGRFLAPVDYSCMGYAIPAALGAKLARPEAPVVALAGDGAFLMTGLELITAASQKIAVAVFVLRDRELAQIAQFQDVALNRKACSVLPDYDLEGLCRGVGVEHLRLDRDAETPAVLARVQELTESGQPVLVDVAIDYSQKTYFTQGVVKTNLLRLPWPDRLRFIGRALARKVLG
ncbi:MAG TPA: thiamine pyrophosphate-binding protein [Vicinamibacteria bacterium]|nr:thiamine pyrophosphate-binding protein [Vicinamibacteria bacterium]